MTTRIGHKVPFRHFIKEWMDHRSVNQEKMAGRLEVESGTISKLLTGRQRLSDKWLTGFAWALDVDVADLFRDPMRPTREELLEGLDDDQVEKVIQIISVIRGERSGTDG